MPKVSVIIPVYGVEKYIERCANSLFCQTLNDIEFIFIDDCTPDRSMDILNDFIKTTRHRFAEKNWIVRTESMPMNSGQAAVRRHGIQLSAGDYIIHCDSDDWMEPEMCESLYTKATQENLDVVFCDYYRSTCTSKTIVQNDCVDGNDIEYYMRKLLTRQCFSSVWNKMVRRDIFENDIVYPQCNMWEDYVLSVQSFYYANKIGYVNEPLYNYFINEQSICFSDPTNKQKQINVNSNVILDFLERKGLTTKYKNEIVVLKNRAREELLTSLGEKKFWKMWFTIYPEINIRYFFTPGIGFKNKIRFLVIILGLYPLVLRRNK